MSIYLEQNEKSQAPHQYGLAQNGLEEEVAAEQEDIPPYKGTEAKEDTEEVEAQTALEVEVVVCAHGCVWTTDGGAVEGSFRRCLAALRGTGELRRGEKIEAASLFVPPPGEG